MKRDYKIKYDYEEEEKLQFDMGSARNGVGKSVPGTRKFSGRRFQYSDLQTRFSLSLEESIRQDSVFLCGGVGTWFLSLLSLNRSRNRV